MGSRAVARARRRAGASPRGGRTSCTRAARAPCPRPAVRARRRLRLRLRLRVSVSVRDRVGVRVRVSLHRVAHLLLHGEHSTLHVVERAEHLEEQRRREVEGRVRDNREPPALLVGERREVQLQQVTLAQVGQPGGRLALPQNLRERTVVVVEEAEAVVAVAVAEAMVWWRWWG